MEDKVITCPMCGITYHVKVPDGVLERHKTMPIQKAWPDGTPTERECLISGLCPDCQIHTFGGDNCVY